LGVVYCRYCCGKVTSVYLVGLGNLGLGRAVCRSIF